MENTLLVGLSRQTVLERQLDVVANNIANVNTAGFKADSSLFEEYLMPGARDGNFRVADSPVSFVRNRGEYGNRSQRSTSSMLRAMTRESRAASRRRRGKSNSGRKPSLITAIRPCRILSNHPWARSLAPTWLRPSL